MAQPPPAPISPGPLLGHWAALTISSSLMIILLMMECTVGRSSSNMSDRVSMLRRKPRGGLVGAPAWGLGPLPTRGVAGPTLPDGIVDTAVGEEVGPQRLFLDLPVGYKGERGWSARVTWQAARPPASFTRTPHLPHHTHLTSMVRTLSASGNRSHTFPFIFSLMIKLWQVFQSPIFMALEAATTCSRIDSGGPDSRNEVGSRQSQEEGSCPNGQSSMWPTGLKADHLTVLEPGSLVSPPTQVYTM